MKLLDKNSNYAIKLITGIPEIQQVDTYFYRKQLREDIKTFSMYILKEIVKKQKYYFEHFGEYATFVVCPIIALDEIEGALLIFLI